MKRDLDLVRSILVTVEKAENSVDSDELLCDKWTPEQVTYHVQLMAHHGLLDIESVDKDMSGQVINVTVAGLTWDGQDYLDAMRDQKVWCRAKKVIKESVSSTTFDVVKQTCTMVATGLIKSRLGM